jgi:hypothetical protein
MIFDLTKVRANTLVRILILCILLFGFAVANNGIEEEKENREALSAEYELKAQILIANLAISNSVIASEQREIDFELSKILVTREKGNKIYEYLTSEKADLKATEMQIVTTLIDGRQIYRNVQNIVVEAAKANKDAIFWHKYPEYRAEMDRYLTNVDLLIATTNIRSVEEHQKHKSFILLSLVFGITFTTFALWKVLF